MSAAKDKKFEVEFIGDLSSAPNFYSDQAQVRSSESDVQIIFGQIMDRTPEKRVVHVVGRVYLSHAHAKSVAEIILNQLSEIEEAKTAKKQKDA